MYNDFVLVGPKSDPGRRQGQRTSSRRCRRSSTANAPFISRGDKSGTHAAELRYWKMAGLDIGRSRAAGYKECGCGMGPALNIGASRSNAYVLTDRGTWLSASRTGATSPSLVEGDKRLFNQYGVMAGQPGQAPAREGQGARAAVRRLDHVAGGAERRSQRTRSAASSCSSRMQ